MSFSFSHTYMEYSATGAPKCAHTGSDEKSKLPATIAIKHQLRKLMFEDAVKTAEAGARAEAIRGQLREETRPLVQSG
jgi:hypothetical protein